GVEAGAGPALRRLQGSQRVPRAEGGGEAAGARAAAARSAEADCAGPAAREEGVGAGAAEGVRRAGRPEGGEGAEGPVPGKEDRAGAVRLLQLHHAAGA